MNTFPNYEQAVENLKNTQRKNILASLLLDIDYNYLSSFGEVTIWLIETLKRFGVTKVLNKMLFHKEKGYDFDPTSIFVFLDNCDYYPGMKKFCELKGNENFGNVRYSTKSGCISWIENLNNTNFLITSNHYDELLNELYIEESKLRKQRLLESDEHKLLSPAKCTKYIKEIASNFPGIRVHAEAGVFSSAVLEYLTSELLELAVVESKKCDSNRITPRHLQMAVKGDEELDALIGAVIAGGVVQNQNFLELMNEVKIGEDK
jgi:hypothetical protein